MKPRGDFRRWDEMVGEVPMCLAVHAAVYHNKAQLTPRSARDSVGVVAPPGESEIGIQFPAPSTREIP